jgi:hypothetical protein
LELNWQIPPGWKATRAWEITADRSDGLDLSGAPSTDPLRRELPLLTTNGKLQIKSLDVVQWTIVAVECSGPTDDRLPEWRFKLPPVPTQPEQFTSEQVPADYSPNRMAPIIFGADHHMWNKQAGRVTDSTCVSGTAVQVMPPLSTEEYFTQLEGGGHYRFSLRVKSLTPPPSDGKIHLKCWASGVTWPVDLDLPLTDLKTGEWSDLVFEADLGATNDKAGVAVWGGWDGLLIDRLEIREITKFSETERFAEQKLRPWPTDLAPAQNGALCVGGLWHETLGLETALKACGQPATMYDWWSFREKRGFNNPELKNPQDFAQYRLIVLANVDLRTFPLEQRAWLKGWVQNGGSLFMTGGPYGLGRGWWGESDILEPIIPAKLKSFDLHPADQPLPIAATGPLSSLTLPNGTVTRWLHELDPKPDSQVALTAGGKPALILGKYGKGRVALLALAPLGEDIPGAWWRSVAGEQITEATCRWLLQVP